MRTRKIRDEKRYKRRKMGKRRSRIGGGGEG
jgi:hypothetical protein